MESKQPSLKLPDFRHKISIGPVLITSSPGAINCEGSQSHDTSMAAMGQPLWVWGLGRTDRDARGSATLTKA